MRSPLSLRVFATERPHFGAHAGFPQLVQHLPRSRVRARLRTIANSDAEFDALTPGVPQSARDWLRHRAQRGHQYWYKLSDLRAELATMPAFLTRGFDVAHMLDGEHTAQFLPLARQRFGIGVPVVATYHQPPAILETILARDILPALDLVTVMSTTQREWFAQFVAPERIAVIHHGIDTEFFSPAPETGSPRDDVVRVLTTGAWQRDWTILAQVAEQLRPRGVHFDVVAAATPALAAAPNVTVHRNVSDEQLRALYRRATLSLLPLVDATANNALLESLACGVPVVASDLPALREYAPAPIARYVTHDAEAFASAVVELANDVRGREQMARDGRVQALTLSWPAVGERFATAYESLTRRP